MIKIKMKSGYEVECVSYKDVDGITWIRQQNGMVYQLDSKEIEEITDEH